MQKLGRRDSTEVTLEAPVELLALHCEAGPAAAVEIITAGQKMLAGERQGQTAWGQYGGLQQLCHKELMCDHSAYATETRVEYVTLKTRLPRGRGPSSWCPCGSSQFPAGSENLQRLQPYLPKWLCSFPLTDIGVATAGLAEGRERKNPPLQSKGEAGGHCPARRGFRPSQTGCKTPQILFCTHSGIARAQSLSRLDIKLIKLVMKVGITPSQLTQGR